MIAIIDYGAGNLGSVYKAFRFIGADALVTDDPAVVESADALVLPGVGAFGHCMTGLGRVRLIEQTKRFIDSGRPFLGICVGLQMLFDESEENAESPGLGILAGRVVKFRFDGGRRTMKDEEYKYYVPQHPLETFHRPPPAVDSADLNARPPERLKVPHIGWNEVEHLPGSKLFEGVAQGERVYFVHSYYPFPFEKGVTAAWSDHGGRFCCAVEWGNVYGTQFHPEKSGAVGLQILRNFASLAS